MYILYNYRAIVVELEVKGEIYFTALRLFDFLLRCIFAFWYFYSLPVFVNILNMSDAKVFKCKCLYIYLVSLILLEFQLNQPLILNVPLQITFDT